MEEGAAAEEEAVGAVAAAAGFAAAGLGCAGFFTAAPLSFAGAAAGTEVGAGPSPSSSNRAPNAFPMDTPYEAIAMGEAWGREGDGRRIGLRS